MRRFLTRWALLASVLVVIAVSYLAIASNPGAPFGWLISVPVLLLIVVLLPAFFYSMERITKDFTKTAGVQPWSRKREALFSLRGYYKLIKPGEKEPRWQLCSVEVKPNYVVIYTQKWRLLRQAFTFNSVDIRWIGHPHRYSEAESELWLDLDIDWYWLVLRLRLEKNAMKRFVESLEAIVPATLLMEHNRRRPNLRHEPVQAFPATQDIYGAWTLDDPVLLYLTPLYLVILQDGFTRHRFALGDITAITAMPRIDAPNEGGLVRFEVEGSTFAFAVDNYDTFTQQLSEVAKADYEELTGQKKKDGVG